MTINWNGKRRWIALLLLLAGIFVMLFVPPVIPVIQLPGEVYPASWTIAGLRLTNTLVASVVVWILLILLALYVARRAPKSDAEVPPGGFYNMFEALFEALYNFIEGIAGGRFFRVTFNMFMTIFLIVLLSNWLELIPGVDSIGFLEPHLSKETGEPTDGYDVYQGFGGAFMLNGKCPWVSPAAAEALTAEEIQARIDNGCKSGIGAPVAVDDHAADAAATEEAHETPTEEAATEAAPTEEAATTDEHNGEAAVTDDHSAEAGEGAEAEHHFTPGDPSVPWVVLPFLRAPSTDLNMTLSLALAAVFMTQVVGFRAQGMGYLTKFFNFKTLFKSPLGGIDVAVGLLELIGEFAKILSFTFRLLGNIFAGSILLFVMSFLVPFLPWPFFILEFFVGIIQALVFGLLTAIFMNLATVGHGHDEEHDEAHAH